MNQRLVAVLAVTAVWEVASAAQRDTVQALDTVTVIGTRAPTALGDASRSVAVIGREQLEALGGLPLAAIIEMVAGADIRERGAGVQADLSMRGGSFEQSLVMVDGMPMTDPQTGHHLLNVPLRAEDVERVEILSGQASRLYGPSAIGGVVNIVTRQPGVTGVRLGATAGERDVLEGWVDATLRADALGLRVSASHGVSDGYRYNSDTDIRTITCRATARVGNVAINGLLGHVDKDFGANGFYSAFYPDQREHTKTLLGMLGGTVSHGNITITPRMSWRRHHDDYVLDYDNPGLYRNITETDVVSGGATASLSWKAGTLSIAADGTWERIESKDLGTHQRRRGGLFLEHVFDPWRLTFTPGVALYFVDSHGWKIWPGGEAGVALTPWLKLWAGADYSFRVPSFTELYTSSPANAGDSTLAAERALSWETGLRFSPGTVRGSISVYRREARDVIDWVRAAPRRQWVVGNVDEVNATGGETLWQVRLSGKKPAQVVRLEAGYAIVDVERNADGLWQHYAQRLLSRGDTLSPAAALTFKYGDDYLRHKVTFGVDHPLLINIRANWRLRCEARNGLDRAAALLDGRVYLNLRSMALYVDVTNIFDVSYQDFSSIPGAPRWVRAGISLALSGADDGMKGLVERLTRK